MHLNEHRTVNGLSLPEAYVEFIGNADGVATRLYNDCPEDNPDFDGRRWEFQNVTGLTRVITVGGAGEQPFHACVQLFVKLYLGFTNADYIVSNVGPLDPDRVCGGFAVAYDNGDYLYLDPFDSFSVWIFHHDGADVQLVADDFETWLARSKRDR